MSTQFPAAKRSELASEHRRVVQPAEAIIERMSPSSGEVVADLGAGTGYITLPLAPMVSEVYALDAQAEMLKTLEKNLGSTGSKVHLVEGKLPVLPFDDGLFDRMIMVNIVHEVEDKKLLAAEVHRCLRPGGRVSVVDFQKMETSFGPPVGERLSMEEMLALFSSYALIHQWSFPEFYQLELARAKISNR
jgi:ubiquinone/menaquinone biosynthesis C-methylase UbiE